MSCVEILWWVWKLTDVCACRKELLADKEKMEQHAAKSREWVQAGMKEDAEKNKSRSAK